MRHGRAQTNLLAPPRRARRYQADAPKMGIDLAEGGTPPLDFCNLDWCGNWGGAGQRGASELEWRNQRLSWQNKIGRRLKNRLAIKLNNASDYQVTDLENTLNS